MRMLIVCTLALALVASAACSVVTAKPPVLNPVVSTSVTVGLDALHTILVQTPTTPPVVIAAVTDAQAALAADISGKTWGAILREMLTTIYSQLPISTQQNQGVAAVLAGLEAALATVGA